MNIVTSDLESFGWSTQQLTHLQPLIALQKLAESKFFSGQFRNAGIGKNGTLKSQIRGDQISWLADDSEFLTSFLSEIQKQLSEYFRCHLEKFEGHFSYYAPGTSYQGHFDQSPDTQSESRDRVFSLILYLNENWQKDDRGELRLFVDNRSVDVEPRLGKLVIFRSDTIFHEVLETRAGRWAVSGWFRRK